MNEFKNIINEQKILFKSDRTKNEEFRINTLKILKKSIKNNESEIILALKKDLSKSETESYISEIGPVYSEINFAIDNLKNRMKKERVQTNSISMPAKSYIIYEPLGLTLIISPWNYPFMLSMVPVISAIASGNTVILKTSRKSNHTSYIIRKIINESFDRSFIYCIDNEKIDYDELLSYKYDHIFFTGSSKVGRTIMKKASENLVKVTLELGGKSPCIVDETSNLRLAAKRIIWGKLLNAGQTCVAPDYLLVHKDVKEKLLMLMKAYIIEFFGDFPLNNPDYPKIIDTYALERLVSLIKNQDIYSGGLYDLNLLKIEPTIIENVDFNNKIMKEEIFGPILPVIAYEDMFDIINKVKNMDKPLSMYIFSEDNEHINSFVNGISAGGVCINDTIMHITNPNLEFGGVGESGMGGYHGKFGFINFSNRKALMQRSTNIDIKVKYPPYSNGQKILLKKIFDN
ncbi:aldehyde dehydrogenase family protein [Anaerococcus sp. AGMB00486]|uniref:Aldehyde dehydrogenase n=1 Tax=Anaerococcus faecalis TaxID=2742993 RepID=A0ABX2N6X9_9FIRM|nr:aldehyde dehydrogenase family protein [Anaerococcus faecalis]NVF10436.1 aldehyde dehydrogenase family protein [Anaerococcus faecalis]